MQMNEKCQGCRSEVIFDTATDDAKLWKKWRNVHSACLNPEPKVKGTAAAVERTGRYDRGYEKNDGWGTAIPIINAKTIPFGFVTNQENEKWNGTQ